LSLKLLQELIGILDTHQLKEIEYQSFFRKIRVVKENSANSRSAHPVQDIRIAQAAELPVSPPVSRPASESTPEPVESDYSQYAVIRSPMVGTFYSAPSPDASPYVKLNDHVKAGTVICIIEAMKLMNEIESDVSGTIVKIPVSNESMVEVNQPLFYIIPD